ncbi:MAG: hypothetical protein WCS01_14830 [bacterium]
MKAIPAILVCCVVLSLNARADDSDDTLRFYMKQSDLVVSGTIVSEPAGLVDETGVINWICTFKVMNVLRGRKPDADTIDVNIVRFEIGTADRPSYLKKDAECILFLKNVSTTDKPSWKTADFWFGIQPRFPMMETSIRRLSEQDKKN